MLAKEFHYSPDHLSALVKQAAGMSLKKFVQREIQLRAARLLANTNRMIGEISDELGFADQYAFSHFFRNVAGVSPSEYRRSLGMDYFPEDFF